MMVGIMVDSGVLDTMVGIMMDSGHDGGHHGGHHGGLKVETQSNTNLESRHSLEGKNIIGHIHIQQ